MSPKFRRPMTIALLLGAAGLALLAARPAGATTFCVPAFDPVRCPDDGQNVAQADLETAMQSEATDGVPDSVIVAAGTYIDPATFSPSGTDPLTVEGAGAGPAGDPSATRLTTASTANIFVVNLHSAPLRAIAMRDMTVVVPAALPDLGGAALQVAGDTLERVDIEIANPGSSGIPSWPGGGIYREGTIYAVGGGTILRAIASGGGSIPGEVKVEDATLREPLYGIWGEAEGVPLTVERTAIERPSEVGFFATESGRISVTNSTVIVDGAADALQANSNNGGEVAIDAEHVTFVQEGSPPVSHGVHARSTSSGDASVTVNNSIVRGFPFDYFRYSEGPGEADLTISHSNLGPGGADLGPGTLDLATGNIDGDPLFAGSVPFGSPTELALQPGSPSIDGGDPAPGGIATDFLGAPRPLDGDGDGAAVRDQGAFETDGPAAPSPPAAAPADPASPSSSPPAATDSAVGIQILGKKVKVNRRGVARLRLRCPAGEANPPCRGLLVLRTRGKLVLGKGRKAKKRRVVLVKVGFKVAKGKTKVVRVELGKSKQQLIRSKRRAREALAIAKVRDGAGNTRIVRKRMRAVPGWGRTNKG